MDEGRVLTCVCMLGYWMWDAVPIWFLYASVLIVGHCADLVSVCFGVDCGTLCRSSFCMLRCWMRGAVPIYFFGDTAGCFIGYGLFWGRFLYASVLDAEHCADLVPVCFGVGRGTLCRFIFIYCVFWALGRMYIRFYCLLSAVEFSAGDVAAVWAAAEEV